MFPFVGDMYRATFAYYDGSHGAGHGSSRSGDEKSERGEKPRDSQEAAVSVLGSGGFPGRATHTST